jgi:hypothetical protein
VKVNNLSESLAKFGRIHNSLHLYNKLLFTNVKFYFDKQKQLIIINK